MEKLGVLLCLAEHMLLLKLCELFKKENFSHGISSVTRTSQGQYTITFSSICSLFVVDSVSVPSLYALGNAHDTTNENAQVVYSMYFHTETASSFKVVHHNFRESSHGFHDPESATAVFFNTDVSS